MRRRTLCIVGLTLASVGAERGDGARLLDRWFAQRAKLKTWIAEVRQTRTLPTLTQPLVSTGRVWFASPNRFRWELGQPPRTIAVRDESALTVYYPRLNRVERFEFEPATTGPWNDALALIEAGFPENRAAFEAQFDVVAVEQSSEAFKLRVRPRDATARRVVQEITLQLNAETLHVDATEVEFVNGSTVHNAFLNPVANQPIEPDRFRLALPDDVELTSPRK